MDQATAALEVRLLGQADVVAAGRSVKFAKRSSTLAMIAFLALRRGKSIARDFLAYTLFPDSDEESALAALRRMLYLATKALPPVPGTDEPWLVSDNETVRWNDAPGATVDALEFERLAGDPSTLARAVELYGGDLLENCYDDWIVVERERLRTLFLQTLSELVARHRTAREYALALGYAHRLLAADSWREDVVRQAIAIRYASGDAPGALAEYDRFTRRLREEMNMGPMPETIALRDLVLRNRSLDEDRASRAPEHTARTERVPFLPFVGRDDERKRLQQNWDRAARGFGNVVILSGEAGIGKTRLVGEVTRTVEAEGGRAFCGGTAFPESPPYQCLVEALRAALPVLSAHPLPALTSRILSRIIPDLQSESPAPPEIATLAPEREAARLFDALAQAFVHIAGSRPLLLVFEDLHWATGTTIDAILTIARRIPTTRALVVGTYRDEETPASHPVRRLLSALGHERRVTHLHLDRFDRNEVARLLRPVEGLGGDEALVERFYALSEGNALFLNEAIADALEGVPAQIATVPSGIRNVIAARVDRLTEVARSVAEIAAVSGHGCTLDVVRDVAGFSLAETLAGFNELLDRQLVREAGSRERFDFVFSHHLIGSSIYDAMKPALRVRRHARTAHVTLQQAAGRDVTRELARHFDLAQMPNEAAEWCIRAARDSGSVHANDDAVRYATRALHHLPGSAAALLLREEANARLGKRNAQAADLDLLEGVSLDAESRCGLSHRRVALARALGERENERTAIGRLQAAATAAKSTYWEGMAACAYARLCVAIAAYDEAKVAARDALRLLADTGSTNDRMEALSALIEANASKGDFVEANLLAAEAASAALASGDKSTQAQAHLLAAMVLLPQQRFADVFTRTSAAVDGFRAIGDRVGEARALVTVATSALRLSRWEEARAANRAAAESFEALGDRPGLASVLMNLGMLHGRCGDLDVARELIFRARELQIQLGDERARTASLLNESFVALWQGDAESAVALAEEALARAQAIGHAAFRAQALTNLGAAELAFDRVDDAIAHMDEGLELQLELGRMSSAVSDLADLALAHARRGDLGAALRIAEQVLLIGSSWIDAAMFPPFPPWVVACIFNWVGDSRAREVLATAAEVSRSFAASIDVPDLRAHYERLPFVTQIEEALAKGLWPANDRLLSASAPR